MELFGTSGIRRIVTKELIELAQQIGLVVGSESLHRGEKTVVIGRDGRLSGPELLTALSSGLRESGCDVINIGEVPTPVLYYAASTFKTHSHDHCSFIMKALILSMQDHDHFHLLPG